MQSWINEPSKQIPVYGSYDVAVVGGGFAGISAALSAARQGARVLLMEKEYTLGGLATLGLITIYLPLCDGCGRQVSFGIVEELFRLSIQHGYEGRADSVKAWMEGNDPEERKKHRYLAQFNAPLFAILAEQLLLENGVEILYGTSFCDVSVKDGSVDALLTESKSGRQAVLAKSVVDATGDADVFFRAGARAMEYTPGNLLAAWYYAVEDGKLALHQMGTSDSTRVEKLLNKKTYRALDADELSEMMIETHKHIKERFLAGGNLSAEHAIASIPTIPQIRMTRAPMCEHVMDDADDGRSFPDSIGIVSNWHLRGPVYEVPFRALYTREIKNLITAGRSVPGTDKMWDVMRVIPCCAVTGQAAGCAAAMSSDFASLDIQSLQQKLEQDGVILHLNQLEEKR